MVTHPLSRAWERLLPGEARLGAELISRWSEPHRFYHDTTHLVASLAALTELGGSSRTEQLAIWFHDAVHTGDPGKDEERSADLAARALATTCLAGAEVDEVVRLVLITVDHSPSPSDLPGARVSDSDLAVLGSSPQCYAASVAGLRAESAETPEEEWRATRLARIEGLLNSELFHTRLARGRWLASARSNLETEQRQLLAAEP